MRSLSTCLTYSGAVQEEEVEEAVLIRDEFSNKEEEREEAVFIRGRRRLSLLVNQSQRRIRPTRMMAKEEEEVVVAVFTRENRGDHTLYRMLGLLILQHVILLFVSGGCCKQKLNQGYGNGSIGAQHHAFGYRGMGMVACGSCVWGSKNMKQCAPCFRVYTYDMYTSVVAVMRCPYNKLCVVP